jgi:hypothetical protein
VDRRHNKPLKRPSIWGSLESGDEDLFHRIFAQTTVEGLESILTRDDIGRPRTFKIVNDEGKKTLEFRQHEGNLDVAKITLWARFVVGLVEAAAVSICSTYMHLGLFNS